MGHQQFTLDRGVVNLPSFAMDSPLGHCLPTTRASLANKKKLLEGKGVTDALQSFDLEQAFLMLNQKLSEIAIDHQIMRIQLEKLSKSETLKEVTKEEPERSFRDSNRRNQDQVIEQLKKEKSAMEIQRDYFANESVKLQEEIFRLEKIVFKQKNKLEELGYISDADQPDPYLHIQSSSPTSSNYPSSPKSMNNAEPTYSLNPKHLSQETNSNLKPTPENFISSFEISSLITHPYSCSSISSNPSITNLSSLQTPYDPQSHLSIPVNSSATKHVPMYRRNRGVNRVKIGKRTFSQLPGPQSWVFKQLKDNGRMYPLNPMPLPNPIPTGWNLNENCEYHQNVGHMTDDCKALRHAIQDFIEAGKISDSSFFKLGNTSD